MTHRPVFPVNPLDLRRLCLLNAAVIRKPNAAVPMDDQNKNLLIATALSFAVILGWFVLFPPPDPALDPDADLPPTAESSDPTVATTPEAAPADRSEATQTAPTEAADA